MNKQLHSRNDTIAAIATAAGEAAIAVVRLSGPQALAIADRVFVGAAPPPSRRAPHSFGYGRVMDPDGTAAGHGLIDEVIVLIFRAPRSFTRQDVVEFQCHGGAIAAQRILRLLIAMGARPAQPGEFTRRAFLNGRLDLPAAEAIIDLVQAQTVRAARTAAEHLAGSLSNSITDIYNIIVGVLAEIEARLDFVEEELAPLAEADGTGTLLRAIAALDALLATWEQGRLVRSGAVVVIAGATNAGKSTLMNALLGYDRVLVSPLPGTTRDTIEEGLQINGIPIRLIDTAGYHVTDCDIEKAGIARTDAVRRTADALLYVVDASSPDTRSLAIPLTASPIPDRTILVFNKIDRGMTIRRTDFPVIPSVYTSLVRSDGVVPVRRELQRLLADTAVEGSPVLIAERHRGLLQQCRDGLQEALLLLAAGESGYVPASMILRDALAPLDECMGRNVEPDVLDRIFSRFCVGK